MTELYVANIQQRLTDVVSDYNADFIVSRGVGEVGFEPTIHKISDLLLYLKLFYAIVSNLREYY